MVTKESTGYQENVSTRVAARARAASIPWALVLPFVVGIFTYIARAIYLGRSFDIFIDEVTYLQISRAIGFRQSLDLAGQPFYLHPPAWFIIEGGFIRLFNVTGNLTAQIYATRFLVAAFAALSAVLVFLIARRAAGWPAALAAALLFALDPFIIKLNSLNMLETSAMAWALAGYWTIISGLAVQDEAGLLRSGRTGWRSIVRGLLAVDVQPITIWRQVLAGVFFGLALLTKEMLVFVTLLPLAVFFVLRWSLPRRAVALIGSLALAVYAIYPASVAASGNWQTFVQEKTHGFVRFAGFVRSTGFKRAGGPSLSQTAIDRLSNYGASYLLFALGVLAVIILLRRGGRINRVIAVWTACTYAMLAYNILFGTLEEQFFYYLIVACVLANAVAAVIFVRVQAARPAGRAVFNGLVILMMLISGFNGFQWANVHLVPNDGFVHVLDYLHAHVPRGQTVASTSETGQYVLQGYLSGPWGASFTVDDLKKFAPDYLLVTPHTLVWNNSNTAQTLLDWIAQNGQLIYDFNGRESNALLLYRLPWAREPLQGAVSSTGTPAAGEPAAVAPAGTAAATALASTATATSAPTAAAGSVPTATAPAPTATNAPPAATASPAAATVAPTAAPTPLPTATAAPQHTPQDVLRKAAAAEADLQTGRFEATLYYGNVLNSTAKADFDARSANGGPRYHLITTYAGAGGQQQSFERIAIGNRAWQRWGNGPWQNTTETEGAWAQAQLFLPHAASATGPTFSNGDPSTVQWHDAASDSDVTLKVDPATGTPQQLTRLTRSNGSRLVVRYVQWNGPVQISPPGR